ncbi:MAG: hypothetical protein LBM67_00125 [Lentimicrobiaceae bacterium]|nr:hypothetical protein [Lentimicrobiaceae bacterium]
MKAKVMASVRPHKRPCDFGGFSPAQSSMIPPLRQAFETLARLLRKIHKNSKLIF